MVKDKMSHYKEISDGHKIKLKKPIENSDIVFYNHFKEKRLTADSYIKKVENLKIKQKKEVLPENRDINEKFDFIYDLKNKEVWKKIKKYKFFQV